MKKEASKNYLTNLPKRNEKLSWEADEKGMITLSYENKGFFNRLAQKLFKKPKISYVHLDEMGSFLWPLLDGTHSVEELGKLVDEQFGEDAYPLYERLAKYIQILHSYGFVAL